MKMKKSHLPMTFALSYSRKGVLDYPWKFHDFFNQPLEIPLAIPSITLEIPYPQPPLVWFFSGIAHFFSLPPFGFSYRFFKKIAAPTHFFRILLSPFEKLGETGRG